MSLINQLFKCLLVDLLQIILISILSAPSVYLCLYLFHNAWNKNIWHEKSNLPITVYSILRSYFEMCPSEEGGLWVLVGYLWTWLGSDFFPEHWNVWWMCLRDLIYSDLYAGHSFSAVQARNSSISLGALASITLSVSPLATFVCRAIKRGWQMARVINFLQHRSWNLMTGVVSWI